MSFADVEALAVAFLKPIANPAKVATKTPNPRPAAFVKAYRTGGSAVNRVLEKAQITVEGEASTQEAAFELTSKCREHFLHRYTLMPLVRGVSEVGGLYFAPDPDTNIPRYRFTVGLMVRAGR
jgi:hypothetical protein